MGRMLFMAVLLVVGCSSEGSSKALRGETDGAATDGAALTGQLGDLCEVDDDCAGLQVALDGTPLRASCIGPGPKECMFNCQRDGQWHELCQAEFDGFCNYIATDGEYCDAQ
jgi:hypothetical protein